MPARIASLCAGAGGLDLGFHQSGATFEYVCDTDSAARETYHDNLQVEPENTDVLELVPSKISGVDLVVAGPPCQGFSSLGSQDPADPRNSVLVTVASIINTVQPDLFLIENVPGLRSLHKGKFAKSALATLREHHYAELVELRCAHFGVPQHRKRILIIGGKEEQGRRFVQVIKDLAQKEHETVTVGDCLTPSRALSTLSNHNGRRILADWYHHVMPHIGKGQKLCDTRRGSTSVHSWEIPEVFGEVTKEETRMLTAVSKLRRRQSDRRWDQVGDGRPVLIKDLSEHLEMPLDSGRKIAAALVEKGYLVDSGSNDVDLARKFNGRFRRLDPKTVSPAVTKDFGFVRTVVHPNENRGLTPRECARLQTFPDWFEFTGTLGDQYRLIANAFPPRVSRAVARSALKVLGYAGS